jgi:GNAT superfamily N-acetyltransferase
VTAASTTSFDPGVQRACDERLAAHLANWLGLWPPTASLVVVGSSHRSEPGWDGQVRPVAGVESPDGVVVSVPPPAAAATIALGAERGLDGLAAVIGDLVGVRGATLRRGVFRYCRRLVTVASPIGEWVPTGDPRVPAWLSPFNGEVLIAFDDKGRYAAGVGRKRHDDYAQEIAVATEPAHRRRGLAASLVAQASARIFEEGAVATYLHRRDNEASAAVAAAAGFPDLGWQVLGMPTAS